MMLLVMSALEVLRLVAGAEESQRELRKQYVYQEVQENWRLDPYGRKIAESYRTKAFEVVWVRGQRYRKLVERNGQPLSAEEKWQVEEDMKRLPEMKDAGVGLMGLAAAYELRVEGNVISGEAEGKRVEVEFGQDDFVVRRQVSEGGGTRSVVEFEKVDGVVSLPRRIEVEFEVEGVRGFQLSRFHGHRRMEE